MAIATARSADVLALAIFLFPPHNGCGMESEAHERKPWWRSFLVGRNPAFTLLRILFVIFFTLVLFKYVLLLTRVTGTSMEPTFPNGKIKVVNRLAYRKSEPQRGDIVVFPLIPRSQILVMKRVIGLPGETVQIVDGHVNLDGERLAEPYASGIISQKIKDKTGRTYELRTSPKRLQLGTNEFFLVGDNREVSELHVEAREDIIGKVIY